MEAHMKRNCSSLTLVAVVLSGVVGCTGEAKLSGLAPASGVVKQKGSPLAGATVTFAPAPGTSNRAAYATTDQEGKFKLTTLKSGDGVMPGDYLVTVTKTETVGKVYTPEEANQYYNEHQKPPPSPEVKNVVGEKFANGETSGLKATVKKGEKNEFTFEVE
jgi:hypothetical protein